MAEGGPARDSDSDSEAGSEEVVLTPAQLIRSLEQVRKGAGRLGGVGWLWVWGIGRGCWNCHPSVLQDRFESFTGAQQGYFRVDLPRIDSLRAEHSWLPPHPQWVHLSPYCPPKREAALTGFKRRFFSSALPGDAAGRLNLKLSPGKAGVKIIKLIIMLLTVTTTITLFIVNC